MSIRLRLTLLYSAILALTLIVFGTALYFTVARVADDSLRDTLKSDALSLQENFVRDQFGSLWLRDSDQLYAKKTLVQVIDPSGKPYDIRGGASGDRIPLTDTWRRIDVGTGSETETVGLPDGRGRLLVYNMPLVVRGEQIGVLRTAQSMEEYDQTLSTLAKLLSIGTIIATLLAFGIGWGLAGAALRPINRITQTARAIGAERDFGRRVRYDGPADEIGRLATTFNGMLGQLGLAYSQVEQALRAQRRFVADASHELRTPLTSIRGNLALLGRRPPISEEDRAAVLADTEEESERLIRLVNDLLVLARADAGRPLKREPVRVGELVDDVCRQARGLAGDRTVICADGGSITALGDRDALKQVLLILVDNAVRFAPPGGHVGIELAEREGCVAITVRDDGPGIAPDALPHIFERFYQGDTSRAGVGTGLGLAIAQQLVEAQSGAIHVESAPGRGSAFTVSLPAQPVSPAEEIAPDAAPDAMRGAPERAAQGGGRAAG